MRHQVSLADAQAVWFERVSPVRGFPSFRCQRLRRPAPGTWDQALPALGEPYRRETR
jgi:hypothetical protein